MKKISMIVFIKTHKSPPPDVNDPYYLREPWKKFGGVSSGICMEWCWFKTDVIDSLTTIEEVEMAFYEILSIGEHKCINVCEIKPGDVFIRNNQIRVSIDELYNGYMWTTLPEYYNGGEVYSYTAAYPEIINHDEYVYRIGTMRKVDNEHSPY